MIGMTRGMPWLLRDFRFHPRLAGGRPLPAFVLGLAFGFGWTPCIGPALGAILTVSAVQTSTSTGVGLLATYAAGLGVPFLLAALFTRELAGRLAGLRRFGTVLQIAAGLILVLMGIAMITGQLSAFAFWLLRTFPALGAIG
jgi:cytochrome c-type biogenesis protein